MSIRVLLVDDHRIVVEGLRELLDNKPDMEVVGVAANGRQAIEMVDELQPDVVLMDVTMADLNGVMATEQVVRQHPEVKVLALSMHANREFVAAMLQAGACGYLIKSAPIDEVVRGIRAAMAGEKFFSSELAEFFDPSSLLDKTAPDGTLAPQLTSREREVLQLVVEGKSSKEIATILFVSTKTVDYHRQSIMNKLNIRSVAELTKYAIREGLTPLDH
ncbi:MAG: response regulator transcription factor [Planctomycetes bacterium]|nr:response regulator transcription factor [Planctomycetota bacterium]